MQDCDAQVLWPLTEPWLELKECSCDSSLLQSLAQALALVARCTAGAIQTEEEERVVAATEEEEEGREAVVAAGKGVGSCGEGGCEGWREDIFTART